MSNRSKKLIVIVGPTASGKTALAVKIAKLLQTEVISADSRQLYKEMSIGTAKPTLEEMEGVVHHFIDSHSISEEYNIGKFEKDALEVIDNLFEKHDTAVLVGGSGLYIKVVCEGMDDVPDSDPDLRKELLERVEQEGLESLLSELQQVDPEYYEKVDRNNTHRVIRGLEVFYASGVPFSSFRTGIKKERSFEVVKVGLMWNREELYARINQRMDLMIDAGLFDEAEKLYPYKENNALQTVGYREIFDFIEGKYDREEAVRLLKRNSRRYAKRQMTWFNKDPDIIWFHPNEESMIIEYIVKKTKAGK